MIYGQLYDLTRPQHFLRPSSLQKEKDAGDEVFLYTAKFSKY